MTVQEFARYYGQYFTAGERFSDDTGRMIRTLTGGEPAELSALVMDAHGHMMPDDFRYEMIEDALEAIAEADDPEEAAGEFADGGSVYTADQLRWLSSRVDRYSYCDEFVSEFAGDPDTMGRVACGMYMERSEVFGLVLASLEAIAEEQG